MANLFNCDVGQFPMKYLGVPVSDRKLLISDLEFMVAKIRKRLGAWQPVSSGGRKILIDSCLSSIVTYIMGFYLLPEGIHKDADMARASFF